MSAGWRPWAAVLAPPSAWAAHLLVGYGAEEVACSTSPGDAELLGLTVVEAGIAVLAVATIAVSAWGGVIGWRVWSGRRDEERPEAVTRRNAFLGVSGAALSVLFVATIALQTVPLLFFHACDR